MFTKALFVKSIIGILVGVAIHYGLFALIPGTADAMNYAVSAVGSVVGYKLADWLHLQDPPKQDIISA